MKRLLGVLAFLALLSAVLMAYDYWAFLHQRFEPYDRPVQVAVAQGASLQAIARQLEEAGIISNRTWFRLRAQRLGIAARLQPGNYRFSPRQLPDEILRMLRAGAVELVRVTFPEGARMAEVAAELERSGIANAGEFLQACRDPALIASLGLADPPPHLEGYLFPETYRFRPNTPARQVARAMAAEFQRNFTPALAAQARALGLSPHEAVTLASLIEKETGDGSERRAISSVFHNRLRRGMRLQSDPTVIYGIENFNGDLTRRDLKAPTSYNTYVIAGLPPTPICNPGLASLEAAVNPADSDYLYFVSMNNGRHLFTSRYADHLAGVVRYQRGGRHVLFEPAEEPAADVPPP